jgi:hypothetical protein
LKGAVEANFPQYIPGGLLGYVSKLLSVDGKRRVGDLGWYLVRRCNSHVLLFELLKNLSEKQL